MEDHAVKQADDDEDPALACVRRMLGTFFPRTAGPGDQIQARSSVPSSAIGRGAMPPGSPSASELIHLLRAEDFTDGGRHDLLYAPWSRVAGGTAAGVALRNEIGAFLRGGTPSPRIQQMVERVRALGRWRRTNSPSQN